MTADYTYLNQLTLEDLLDRARQAGPDNHLVRALADRLEETFAEISGYDCVYGRLSDELADAERRADSWRDEAAALQRQLDMVRG